MNRSSGFLLIAFALSVAMGLITALIAQSKGRHYMPWLAYGFLVPLIGFLHASVMAAVGNAPPRAPGYIVADPDAQPALISGGVIVLLLLALSVAMAFGA